MRFYVERGHGARGAWTRDYVHHSILVDVADLSGAKTWVEQHTISEALLNRTGSSLRLWSPRGDEAFYVLGGSGVATWF